MISASDISIIVITKDRLHYLDQLLQSFRKLQEFPKEILIITKSGDLTAERSLVEKNSQLNINLIFQKSTGYAAARNMGIKNASGEIVAFVDDDCTVPPNWISELVSAHNRFGSMAAVMGKAVSMPPGNLFAAIAQLHYDNWVNSICRSGKCVTVDAKITSFDRNIFIHHNIWFDSSFNGGSEDVEFGYRLGEYGFIIYYEPKITFYHWERTTLTSLLNQRWRNAKGESLLRCSIKNSNVGMVPLSRMQSLPTRIFNQLIDWLKHRKYWWCIGYIIVLPVFFLVRICGYWWGWSSMRYRDTRG